MPCSTGVLCMYVADIRHVVAPHAYACRIASMNLLSYDTHILFQLECLLHRIKADGFPLYGYGNKWRTARRMFHHFFNPGTTLQYQPQQSKSVRELLYRLAHKPDDFMDHLRLYVVPR
jgi:hypothetical protein